MVTARLRSAAALAALLLLGFAGESVAWHDHPLDSAELVASRISVVEAGDACGPHEHIDRGHDVLRGACVACIHGFRPGAQGAPAVVSSVLPVRLVARVPKEIPARSGVAQRLEAVRGPPAVPALRFA